MTSSREGIGKNVSTLSFPGAGKPTESVQWLTEGIWRCQWLGAGFTCDVLSSLSAETGFVLENGMDLSDSKQMNVMRGGCYIEPSSSGAGVLLLSRASDG